MNHKTYPLNPDPPRALVLAAGRGERMRPLTDHTPKPLLTVQGRPLMAWALADLQAAGVQDIVINTAWLGDQIEAALGHVLPVPGGNTAHPPSSNPQGLITRLHYSHEGRDFGGALETLGGICRALPLLSPDGQAPFWVAAGDVFCPGFDFANATVQRLMAGTRLAHLWLVPNPEHNPNGDFAITAQGLASNATEGRFTFSSIALYRPELFAPPYCTIAPGNPTGEQAALRSVLRLAADEGRITAEVYHGPWTDVGTPERLAALNQA